MARTPRIDIATSAGGLAVVLNLLVTAMVSVAAAPPQTPTQTPTQAPTQPLILANPFYATSQAKASEAEAAPEVSTAVANSASSQAPGRYASTKAAVETIAEPSDWNPPTVENPFSPDARLSPRNELLRWGPVSRWRSPGSKESETALATDTQPLMPLAEMPHLEPTGIEEAAALSAAFGVEPMGESMDLAGEGLPPDAASWVTNEIKQPTWLQTAEIEEEVMANNPDRWHSPEEGPFDPFETPVSEPDTEPDTATVFVSDDSVIPNDVIASDATGTVSEDVSESVSEDASEAVSDSMNLADTDPKVREEVQEEFRPEFRPISQPERPVAQASAYTRYPPPPALPEELVRTNRLQRAQLQAQSAESIADFAAVIKSCESLLAFKPAEDDAVEARQLSAWAHNRSGELFADDAQQARAMQEFELALQFDPANSLALHNRAIQLAQQGEYEQALRDFSAAIEQNPGLNIAYRNRAELLSAMGQSQAAIDDYTVALRHQPDDEQLLVLRAHSLHRIRDYSEAMADFNAALRLVPTNPDAYTGRGNLHAELGQYRKAIEDYRQALLADANWGDAYRSLAWLLATCPDPHYQNPRRAMLAARQAAKFGSKDDPFVLEALAAASASAGQFRAAAELQQRALAVAPGQVARRMEHRLALYQQEQPFLSGQPTGVQQASYEE